MRLGCNLANGKVGGDSKIGCALGLDFRYLDGASFMSRDVYGHLCTPQGGAKWQLDGFYFAGDHYYIDCGNPAVLQAPPLLTLEARVKRAAAGTYHTVIGKYRDAVPNYGYNFEIFSTNLLQFFVSTGNGNFSMQTASTIPANQWKHLEGVYDGSEIREFIDGRPDGTPVAATGTITVDTVNVFIGANSVAGDHVEHMNGLISLARIYNLPRYAAQVLQGAIDARRN